MTKKEIRALTAIAERITELASLENASFSNNADEDKKIKDSINPYMGWFDYCAQFLREIVELQDESDRWLKSEKLSEIIRLC